MTAPHSWYETTFDGPTGEYAVVLRTGTRLTLSRGYREKLQDRLGRGL